MKWFFAFNEAAIRTYGDMIRVAVHSALEYTSLEPFALYDGPENAFTLWLKKQGVTIFPKRSRFYDEFIQAGRERNSEGLIDVASGTFLRLEIGDVMREHGFSDEFVFYTDIDVMFMADPVPLLRELKPRFFAVAPELWPNNYLHMNAGVMLQNLPVMRKYDERFTQFIRAHFNQTLDNSWDQGAYRAFFDPLHRLLWKLHVPERVSYRFLLKPQWSFHQWEKLPPELNWKPYWEQGKEAKIVHFHGPKPHHREMLRTESMSDTQTALYNEHFEGWCDVWEGEQSKLEALEI